MWLWEDERDSPSSQIDGRAFELKADVLELRAWFANGLERPPSAAYGYGTAWRPYGSDAFPFVLLGSGAFRRSQSRVGASEFLRPVPVEELLSTRERSALKLPRTRLPLLAMAGSIPEPSSGRTPYPWGWILRRRKAIYPERSTKFGTAGVAVSMPDGSQGTLTAGHVFPAGLGALVEVASGLIGSSRRPFGTVSHHEMPAGRVGWDAAIIRSTTTPAPVKRAITRFPPVRNGQELAYTDGAESGFVDQISVVAGLEEVRGAHLGWRCCWLIGPTDALRGGDSGAAVFAQSTDELLGTYVGRSYIGPPPGKTCALYVQDAHSLAANVLRGWGVSF